jgi:hypothetical protein
LAHCTSSSSSSSSSSSCYPISPTYFGTLYIIIIIIMLPNLAYLLWHTVHDYYHVMMCSCGKCGTSSVTVYHHCTRRTTPTPRTCHGRRAPANFDTLGPKHAHKH